MAFVGDPSLFIGSDIWFAGNWYDAAVVTDNDYLGLRNEDLWVYYNEEGRVIAQLDFGSVLPTNSIGQVVRLKYRGHRPIKVLGFYLREMEGAFYDGSKTPVVDRDAIVRWADHFTGPAVPPGTPGLEIQYTDVDTGLPVITQVQSGFGDSPYSPVEYNGHRNGIVQADDMLTITLRLTAPDDEARQLLEAGVFHFAIDVSFIQLPERFVTPLLGESC